MLPDVPDYVDINNAKKLCKLMINLEKRCTDNNCLEVSTSTEAS